MVLHLRRTREAQGLRLRDVAPAVDRCVSMLSYLELGEAPLTLTMLEALARHYGVHPWELVSFPDFPPPPCPRQMTAPEEHAS